MNDELPSTVSKIQAKINEDIDILRKEKPDNYNYSHLLNRLEVYYDPDIVPDLIEFLASHKVLIVRRQIAKALRNYQGLADIVLPALIKAALTDEDKHVRERAVTSIGTFWGKAVPFIPKLEEIIKSDQDFDVRQQAANVIELLKRPMIYPTCPKCNQHSFAYHPIPSTQDVERNLQERRIFQLKDRETLAAIVYCLNCGHIVGSIGGKGYPPR